MEQTLGKRIMENRKRLNLTQDKLAEKLDVTAQAVSKWENDQSYPDITMIPKLAEIFGISTDELLGLRSSGNVNLRKEGMATRKSRLISASMCSSPDISISNLTAAASSKSIELIRPISAGIFSFNLNSVFEFKSEVIAFVQTAASST